MSVMPGDGLSVGRVQQLQEALRLGLAVVTEQWSYSTADWVTCAHAADIDGDGDYEVLIGSRDGSVSVLTRKGVLKWKRTEQFGSWIGAIYCVNNVDAVDHTRIIVGSRTNKVTALDETGKMLWQYSTRQVVRSVCVQDINNDGKAEVLVGAEDCTVHVLACETGERLWEFATNGWIRSVFPIDLDGDGETEVLAASGDKHLYIINSKGELKCKYNVGSNIHALWAGDLDLDGENEILVGSDVKDLYVMKPDGRRKWEFFPENRIHSIHAVDFNHDGRLEIVAGSEDDHIYFLDDKGILIWRQFLGQGVFRVYPVDLNRDGIWELLVGAEDNTVHVLAVELAEGLLTKIIDNHSALGKPYSWKLNFSPTESALLRDLTNEALPREHDLTMAHVEQLLASRKYATALSALLNPNQQYARLLWTKGIGHNRAATLNTGADTRNMEIVVGTDEGDIKVLDTHGNILWTHSFNECIRTVQVADIDQDGTIEIITRTTDGHVYLLDITGQAIKWQTQFNDRIESICTDGTTSRDATEVIFCSADNKIHVYTGKFLPVIEPIVTPQSIQIVRTCDINRDGKLEIIAGAKDDNVYAYTREGKLLWTYTTRERVNAIFAEDIDNDGCVEIIVGSEDRNIHVLDNNGSLKWCYSTPRRVIDVDVIDADHDGQYEVFVGVGNGYLYVLNGVGDVLWQFEANDRIRVIRVADMNGDGKVEILVGSEDRLYLLQMVDQQQLHEQIAQCWQALLERRLTRDVLYDLIKQPDAKLRAFALTKLASLPDLSTQDFTVIDKLLTDGSYEVKKAFATVIVDLYRSSPQKIRTLLEILSMDPRLDIRLAFIDNLPELCRCNPQLGFEYLDRFTRNVNKWIRRTVVRKLDQLVHAFPQRVFNLLLHTIEDEADWIRQESARALAHYFDIHGNNLIRGVRLLIMKELDPSLLNVVIHCATTPNVQNIFRSFVELLDDSSMTDILDKLRDMIAALEDTRSLLCGESMFKIHYEFYCLHRMRTIDEIAHYKCMMDNTRPLDTSNDETHFDDTLHVLHQLNTITNILRKYLRREGLGDRISSLLEATTAIDSLSIGMAHSYFTWSTQQEYIPDYRILKLLLVRWRSVVIAELGHLRGKAELRPELQTRKVPYEKSVGIVLSISNSGRSPADNVTITLRLDENFTVIGDSVQTFETISTNEPELVEFTIKPHKSSLQLAFDILYDDAEAKEKILCFGDRLDLIESKREFKRIYNPYYTGTPIQEQNMFYGRKEELALLQEDFVHSSANTVVVLYGQRRSGKSSLLYQLIHMPILDPHIPVRIDMQHETLGFSTSKFLRNIAQLIHREIGKKGIFVAFPEKAIFDEDATFAFDMFLDEVEEVFKERKLVILIDEFEILEEKVTKNELDRDIFVYLRSLMQERRGIHFLLAGTHTIKELTAEYWSIFFNIAGHHRISKLAEEAARQLIKRPVEGTLEYDPFALEKIRHLTGDQPYLIQLICHTLVHHCNTQQKNYVTINDVNIVQESVMETGNVYFSWIWDQASKQERVVLAIVAQEGGDEGHYVSLTDIERIYRDCTLSYKREHVLRALLNLRDGDVIIEVPRENRFKIPVGLTRIWLRETKQLQSVILEENLLA